MGACLVTVVVVELASVRSELGDAPSIFVWEGTPIDCHGEGNFAAIRIAPKLRWNHLGSNEGGQNEIGFEFWLETVDGLQRASGSCVFDIMGSSSSTSRSLQKPYTL